MPAIEEFIHFLKASPTAFHAAHEIGRVLAKAGFLPLCEKDRWQLEMGKGYFLIRDNALAAAFRLSDKTPISSVVLASHLDSPSLKIKPHPEISNHGIGQLGTEVYGGPLLHTWLDRDLYLAGRISVLDEKGQIQSILVSLNDSPLVIPSLAIHLDRSVMDKGILVHKQDHLRAIFTLDAKEKHLESLLQKRHKFKKLLSFDLFLAPAEPPSFLGVEKEMIAGARLDNLTAAYAALYAMEHSKAREHTLQMALFWDHEEVGSTSLLGADSCFANQLFDRIGAFYKMNGEDLYRLKSCSICLSGDLSHGFHPNFAEKYDPQHACLLGHGVALKFNANQKYATSSLTASSIIQLADKHKLRLQKFVSRSDIASGSTVGSMMAAQIGIPTVDLGISGWAMHSTREVIASKDELALMDLFLAAVEELG